MALSDARRQNSFDHDREMPYDAVSVFSFRHELVRFIVNIAVDAPCSFFSKVAMNSKNAPSGAPNNPNSDAAFGKGVLKSSIGLLGGRIAQPFFTFFLFFVSARVLSTGEFGYYTFIMGMLVLFQSIASLGLGFVLSREIGQKPEEEGAAIGSVLYLCLPASVLAGLAFIAVSSGLMGNDGNALTLYVLSALSLPFSALFQFGEAVFLAHSAGGSLFRIGIVEQVFRVGLSIAALLSGFGLLGLVACYLLGRVLATAIIVFLFFKKRMSPPIRLDRGNLRYVWGRLAAFLPMNLLANLYYRADVIVLAWLMSDSDLGLYGCAMRIASFGFILPDALITASYPHFSRLWLEKNGTFEKKALSYSVMLLAMGFLGAAGMAFFGGTLLELFFGSKYAASGPLLALLGFMLPANCLNGLFGYLMQATHHEKTALVMVAVSTLVVFFSLTFGTVLWGLAGAGVGAIASIWAMAILYIAMARRVWQLELHVRSPIIRASAVFTIGWLIIAAARPADNLTYCLMASAIGLVVIVLGGLAGALTPKRIKDVFN